MKILAATDGSRRAEAAVRFAGWLASRFPRGELEIVLVGDARAALVSGERLPARTRQHMEELYRLWARRVLSRAVREASRAGVEAAARYVQARRIEPIARTLDREARARKADLLVVGSRGAGAVGRALLGSVARRLVHVSSRPLIVVPAPVRGGGPLSILVATDGSRAAAGAVRFAAHLIRRARRGALELVTIGTLRRDLTLGFSSAVLSLVPYRELRDGERRATERILRAGVAAARSAGVRPGLHALDPRTPRPVADLLADFARRRDARLLAVGREGRSTLDELALGSVTRRLLSVSRRPVLVVGSPRRR